MAAYIRSRTAGHFLERLYGLAFLHQDVEGSTRDWFLRPPLKVRIRPRVVSQLMNNYVPHKEIGGILGGRPCIIGGEKQIVVTHAHIVPNRSQYAWREYLLDDTLWTRSINHCIGGTNGGTRYLPIGFHTHPNHPAHPDDPLAGLFNSYSNLATSEADRHPAHFEWLLGDGHRIQLPNALVKVIEGQLFLALYGGAVCPTDLSEVYNHTMAETVVGFAAAAWDAAGDSGAGKALAVLGSALFAGANLVGHLVPGGAQHTALSQLSALYPTGVYPFIAIGGQEELQLAIPHYSNG